MKKILLGTASALALGLFATSAMASGNDFWGHSYGRSTTDNTAVAVGVQLNSVENDGDIVIGSQAETHKSKNSGYDGYGWYSRSSTYDHNDEGKVFNSNTIGNSFNGSAGLVNVNQNNGNNVSQDAQNTVAAILGCDCGDGAGNSHGSSDTDNVAVAVGLQASYVSNGYKGDIIVDVADQSNTVRGSFNGSAGLFNVNQNNGNNVSQKAQNTVAAIIAKK